MCLCGRGGGCVQGNLALQLSNLQSSVASTRLQAAQFFRRVLSMGAAHRALANQIFNSLAQSRALWQSAARPSTT
jgi:hypothetical protein